MYVTASAIERLFISPKICTAIDSRTVARDSLITLSLFLGGSGCGGGRGLLPLLVLLEWPHEGHLVLRRLEAAVTELGAGVDELQLDLLQSLPLGVDQQGLAQGDHALLRADAATLVG